MKFRPNIGSADFNTKARHVRRFLENGERVKVTVMFRGREAARPEAGRAILDRVAASVADIAKCDEPRIAGRDMVMFATPKGKRDGGPGVRQPRRPTGGQDSGRHRAASTAPPATMALMRIFPIIALSAIVTIGCGAEPLAVSTWKPEVTTTTEKKDKPEPTTTTTEPKVTTTTAPATTTTTSSSTTTTAATTTTPGTTTTTTSLPPEAGPPLVIRRNPDFAG